MNESSDKGKSFYFFFFLKKKEQFLFIPQILADKKYIEQENIEPPKRTLTRGMRKQMESANGAPTKTTTQKKRYVFYY